MHYLEVGEDFRTDFAGEAPLRDDHAVGANNRMDQAVVTQYRLRQAGRCGLANGIAAKQQTAGAGDEKPDQRTV